MMISSNNTNQTTVDASTEMVSTPTSSPSSSSNSTSTSINKYNILNLVAYLINVFVTFSVGQFGLGGRPSNGELSDKYPTLVTPSGRTFSIWGPIFIIQALWVLWQICVPSQRNSIGVYKVGYAYAIAAILFQCGWTLSFSWEIMWLSLVCMYGICITLVYATLQLQTYEKGWKGYFLWQFPLSLHGGWIIAASAVNTNLLFVFYNAASSTQVIISGITLGVLAIVGLSWLVPYPVDFTPPCVLVWALYGVYSKLSNPPSSIAATFTNGQIASIKYTVVAGLAIIGFGIIVKILYVLCVQRPSSVKSSTHAVPSKYNNDKNNDDTSDEEKASSD